MKRVLSIQDISCVGKCSLTVALPVLSAAGLEASILPTSILSTHTAFKGFTFRDLTEDILPIARHWKEQKIEFDGIYTGYLGSVRQIEAVERVFSDFKTPGQLCFVDPAMGDNGELYVGFTPEFARRMGKLCSKADIIVPNLTEAAYMLGEECLPKGYSEKAVKELLLRLTALGAPTVVLTGISYEPGRCGVAGYDCERGEYFSYFSEQLPVLFHGTGDVFASAFFGALMREMALSEALKTAVDFTVESMRCSLSHADYNWYGVDFETALPKYIEMLNGLRQAANVPHR